jgi:hypothetical protein
MKKVFFSLFLFTTFNLFSQNDIVVLNVNKNILQKRLDSAMHAFYYVTLADAEKVLQKPAYLKDSSYKCSQGVLRYMFNYHVNKAIDSSAKGRLFFSYEQYANDSIADIIYKSILSENKKTDTPENLASLEFGNEGFLSKDNLKQPFIFVRKRNKIFKFRVYFISDKITENELKNLAKKVVETH